jgi:hypothetical protein
MIKLMQEILFYLILWFIKNVVILFFERKYYEKRHENKKRREYIILLFRSEICFSLPGSYMCFFNHTPEISNIQETKKTGEERMDDSYNGF